MRRHQRSRDGEKRRARELHQRITARRKVVKVNRDSYGRREDCHIERAIGRNGAAVRLYDSVELYDCLTRHLARSLTKETLIFNQQLKLGRKVGTVVGYAPSGARNDFPLCPRQIRRTAKSPATTPTTAKRARHLLVSASLIFDLPLLRELFALIVIDIDFRASASTFRVEESSGPTGQRKVWTGRTVLLHDPEDMMAMRQPKRFLKSASCSDALAVCSKRGGPLYETNILNQGLHRALKALGLKKAGMHTFRRGLRPSSGTYRCQWHRHWSSDGTHVFDRYFVSPVWRRSIAQRNCDT